MNFKGQVWIETVLYTLIGLALIGLVLGFVTPKINESKDRAVIEQTIESLRVFDEKIQRVLDAGQGNVRNIDFNIKRGELIIDGPGDKIEIVLKGLEEPYSEVGESVSIGKVINVSTEKEQKKYSVNLTLSYSSIDILGDSVRKFSPVSVPYKFSVSNLGGGQIDIRERA